MKSPAEPAAVLGSGHCCVCTGVCCHVGPAQFCATHATNDNRLRYTPHFCPICGVRH